MIVLSDLEFIQLSAFFYTLKYNIYTIILILKIIYESLVNLDSSYSFNSVS